MNEGAPIIIKKKKAHGHGHHGGAWKVAYADFVTAMMAFFLVMWIMGMSDEDRNEIQGYFQDPMGYTRTAPKGRLNLLSMTGRRQAQERNLPSNAERDAIKDKEELKKIEGDFVELLAQRSGAGDLSTLIKNIEWHFTDKGLEIEFVDGDGVAYFALGSDQVTPAARSIITEFANIVGKSSRVMEILGHTDARQYVGSGYDNLDLSTDRAQSVKRVMLAGGVRREQVVNVQGWASRRLKVPKNPLDPRNRRVTILIPYLSQAAVSAGAPNEAAGEVAQWKNEGRAMLRAPRVGDIAPTSPAH